MTSATLGMAASAPPPAGSPRWRLASHAVVMGLVFLGALGVGYLLLPGDYERIAMLERDGQNRQALDILEQRFAAGDRNQRTLFQLQGLYEERGDLPRARRMLELLAAARPRDANVQRNLAELYRAVQDEAGYIRALEARLAARYSEPACKELIGLHRRAGNFEAEERTIADCNSRGYRRPDDIIRLAHLMAADGKLAEASGLLRSVDDRRRLREDRDRLMLFASLIEAGAADEAKRRAARWFKGSQDDGLVLQIIDTLAAENRHDLAMDLAREVGKPGDSISLAVAELMLDRDQVVAARSYLRGWLEAARLTEPEIAGRVVRAALDAEDPMLAYRAAELHDARRLPQDDLVALAEALSAIDQKPAFQAIRALIQPEHIKDNALLAAAVEVDRGKPEPARQLLSRVQVKALDEWRLALWARLMTSTGRRATAEQTLREIAAEVGASAGRSVALPTPVAANAPPTEPAAATPRTGEAGARGAAPEPARPPLRTPRAAGPPQTAAATPADPPPPPQRIIRRSKAPPPAPAAKAPPPSKASPRRTARPKRPPGPAQKAPEPVIPLFPTPQPFATPG